MTSSQPDVADIQEWVQELEALHRQIAPHFARAETRRRVLAYLKGLLSPLERKNGWQLAEEAGERTPDGMQRLLNTAPWDADAVRDDLLGYVREHLAEPGAIVVIDETGFLKKGCKSAGVKRQYSGTAGKRENCQIGVFLAYSALQGHVLVDRELYLPQEWTEDQQRRREAGIPDEVAFATKPELAQHMLEHVWAAGLPVSWVTGDSVYGGSGPLRAFLEKEEQAYVLALASNDGVDLPWRGMIYHLPVQEVLSHAITSWHCLSAGEGSKGPRFFEWALVSLAAPSQPGWGRWLLARRSLEEPDKLTTYLVFAKADTVFETMVAVAGRRWTVEESLQLGKGEVGLDQYEVRSWTGWYRHITLSMLALAYLTVVRAFSRREAEKKGLSTLLSCR